MSARAVQSMVASRSGHSRYLHASLFKVIEHVWPFAYGPANPFDQQLDSTPQAVEFAVCMSLSSCPMPNEISQSIWPEETENYAVHPWRCQGFRQVDCTG